MKNLVVITVICLALIVGGIVLTVIGILNTTQLEVTEDFQSQILPFNPDLSVYLPPTYDLKFYAAYPVLYIHGGQALMADWDEDNGEGTLKDTLDRLIKNDQLDEVVVVTVYDEAHPVSELAAPLREGGTSQEDEAYIRFVDQELEPYIEEEYRVLDQGEHLVFEESEQQIRLEEQLKRLVLEHEVKNR